MTKLYHCNSNYNFRPIVDINPLILRKYKNKKILVLCSREGMQIRINKLKDKNITVIGFWERSLLDQVGGINYNMLSSHDAVVILGRNRVHNSLKERRNAVEYYFGYST